MGMIGHEDAWLQWRAAMAGPRMHHAWILGGKKGLGKAHFAEEAARLLVAEPGVDQPRGNHPDVITLSHLPANKDEEKKRDEGKPYQLKRNISIDQIRQMQQRLNTRPTLGSRRAIIIDPADDMEKNASNALLKSLEEPPAGTYFLLVTHRPGRLLPTIRSRCRTLAIPAMEQALLASQLHLRLGLGANEAQRLAAMSRGAMGRAMRLAQSGAIAADDAARGLLTSLPKGDEAALLALADSFRGGDGAARFALVFERLAEQVREMAVADSLAGRAQGLDRWAEVWTGINRLAADTEALNLDRTDALWSAVAQLRAAAA